MIPSLGAFSAQNKVNASNNTSAETKRISIFGSTGSIGRSTLDIVRKFPEQFQIFCLVANSDYATLAQQIIEFKPKFAVIVDEDKYNSLKQILSKDSTTNCEILSGYQAAVDLASQPGQDLHVAAVVGIAGLQLVLSAANAGIPIALANKESLVAGGKLVQEAIVSGKNVSGKNGSGKNSYILPVDSEHSAIFQLLENRSSRDIESLTLTASGGPFFTYTLDQLKGVTPELAINHPRWKMGPKISVDSATMFNKALELIEAAWLFSMPENKINILIHPQSIVHSMIELKDSTCLAHMSVTDMKGPIAYAMFYPYGRAEAVMQSLNLSSIVKLEFFELDQQRFPAVSLARQAINAGGATTAVLNAANEAAVGLFLSGKLDFLKIPLHVSKALEHFGVVNYSSLEELLEIDSRTRIFVSNL
jgi:1-deoxy-D-xylulose-5-phosphate reductoisomerase